MLLLNLMTPLAFAAEEEEVSFGIVDIFLHSGPIALAVIFILLLMTVATVIVGIERLIAFGRARRQSMALAATVVKQMQSGDISKALKLANDEAFKSAYLGALLRAGLREMQGRRDKYGLENAKRAIEKAMGEEISKMRRGMTILATVGSTAPFVGLFGTTFGVINAFQGMATKGAGLAGISAGISEALITTGVGIGVAVLGVWVFNYFNGRVDKVTDELQSSEADILDWAAKLIQPRVDDAPTNPGVAAAGK